MGPQAKRARLEGHQEAADAGRVPMPEELEEGTPVIYWGEYHGLIQDAFAPLDEFWVTEAATGKIVRDESGEIVQFKASELRLVIGAAVGAAVHSPAGDGGAAAAAAPEAAQARSGVLVIGREEQMVKVLEHFGPARSAMRSELQQLLAIPCNMCSQEQLAAAAAEGVTEEVLALARSLRPDIHVGVRALNMKQAAERVGPEMLLLEGFYVLSAVQAPYGQEAIQEPGIAEAEKQRRRDLCNQVDLNITASTARSDGETHGSAARRALGEACCVELSDALWRDDVQTALRHRVGVPELARTFVDRLGTEVCVVLLPESATASTIRGVLCFGEGSDVMATATDPAPVTALEGAGEGRVQGKTIKEWEAEQEAAFSGKPKLPPGWLRIKSRTTGEVYYFNKKTLESTFELPEMPLPPGWTKQVSKSTGKVYYFHAQKKASTFERPTA